MIHSPTSNRYKVINENRKIERRKKGTPEWKANLEVLFKDLTGKRDAW
jgi:hypothetical protein